MKKQLLFRRFPAVLLALLTVLMLALLPACGGMTTRPMGEDDGERPKISGKSAGAGKRHAAG